MKKIIYSSALFLGSLAFAQVAIGKTTISNNSVSLEFGDYTSGNGKGLVLPWVTSAATMLSAEKGTLVFDVDDKVVKYKKQDGTWFGLSKNETTTVDGTANYNTTGIISTTLQDNLQDQPEAKTSIGESTAIPGILVLEDDDKAMVLPKVPNPHLNIVNPEPGTMVYDTVSKHLAVFNGKVWSYWKP